MTQSRTFAWLAAGHGVAAALAGLAMLCTAYEAVSYVGMWWQARREG